MIFAIDRSIKLLKLDLTNKITAKVSSKWFYIIFFSEAWKIVISANQIF